jgi:5-methylcytosine-specific restriction protein A
LDDEMSRGTLFGVWKRCGGCKTWKEEDEFHKDKANKDGLSSYCKPCEGKYRKVRRKRVKDNGGAITDKQCEDLKKKHNYTCLRCGKKEPEIALTLDHVISVLKRGKNLIKNIQPLCVSCNSKKGSRIIDYRA